MLKKYFYSRTHFYYFIKYFHIRQFKNVIVIKMKKSKLRSCVRVRPCIREVDGCNTDIKRQHQICVVCNADGQTIQVNVDNYDQRQFQLDYSFHSNIRNEDIYRTVFRDIVDDVVSRGFNGAAIAYGQTGSGKTHTMIGNTKSGGGMIQLSIADIFTAVKLREAENVVSNVVVCMFQVYIEHVYDLIPHKSCDLSRPLNIREDPLHGSFIEDITYLSVSSEDMLLAAIDRGLKNRVVKSTLLNSNSSRSHVVVKLFLDFEELPCASRQQQQQQQQRYQQMETSINNNNDNINNNNTNNITHNQEQVDMNHETIESPSFSQSLSSPTTTQTTPLFSHPYPLRQYSSEDISHAAKNLLEQLEFSPPLPSPPPTPPLSPPLPPPLPKKFRRRSITFVDLAGSERVKKSTSTSFTSATTSTSNAIFRHTAMECSRRLKESVAINTSIAALGNCIHALIHSSSSTSTSTSNTTSSHVPLRDSKLTRLLSEALGGNSKTVMLCCVSPSLFNVHETLSTLLFATRSTSPHFTSLHHIVYNKYNMIYCNIRILCIIVLYYSDMF